MSNRFVEMDARLRGGNGTQTRRGGAGSANRAASASRFVQPFSAVNRELVVLMENGGVDLGIPKLVDKLLASIPGSDLFPSSAKADLVRFLGDKVRSFTDSLLETAELTLNRYHASKPDLFGEVTVLRNGTATYQELKSKLIGLSQAGRIADVLILTHGDVDVIAANGDIDGAKIRAMKAELGRPLSIRSVYMMNCVGSSLNQAWLDAGAKASAGSIRNNYLPEPTTCFYWSNWKEGQTFEAAVTNAYRRTIALMNDAVRGFVGALPIPGSSLLASQIDLANLDFVRDSAPVIGGYRSVTVTSDDLSFSHSMGSSLATTVLPVSLLQSVASGAIGATRSVSPHGMELIRVWENDTRSLADKIVGVQQAVNDTVKAALNQNQFDALVSFVCGIGVPAFQRSTLLRHLNEGHHAEVPAEINKWVKARQHGAVVEVPDLVRRRAAEADLFQQTAPAAAAKTLSRFGLALSGVDAEITGDLPAVQQPSPMTCWAAVMTMMYSWRHNTSMAIRDVLATFGPSYVDRFDRNQSLDAVSAAALYDTAGLVRMTSSNPTIEEWARLITTTGPLYVDIGFGTSSMTHAVIVRAIRGDGTAAGTSITVLNPADATTRTMPFSEFLSRYEAPGAVRSWPHVIVHWPSAPAASKSFSYYRASDVVTSLSNLSYQQNPIAGIVAADAAQIGLGAIAVLQSQAAASAGSFTMTYTQAQRLLTNEARQAMPGSQSAKERYSRALLHLEIGRAGTAKASVIVEWEGNAYGEIGTPVIRRDLVESTDWSKSSANITIYKIDRIPLPNTDPRTWPIVYTYEGTFDPLGNGHFEFTGEFEVNAFGGLVFNRHQVVSRSLADWALSRQPDEYVQKGPDATAAVPQLPPEQLSYLRTRLP